MKIPLVRLSAAVACLLAFGTLPLSADDDHPDRPARLKARLAGIQEVPVVSSSARGEFSARIESDTEVSFSMSYEGLEGGNVLFAHIHLAQPGVNGAVMTFLCGGGTKPTACPAPGGTVEGTIVAADIQAIATQQVPAGAFDEFVSALRRGVAYVNVHTTASPGGEIRGQIFLRGRD